jgi:SAM-dependent methyltransferase
MSGEHLESWHSGSYVTQWAAEDVVADMLDLPQRMTVELLVDAGIEVEHVIDLGSGPGGYLARLLDAFPGARGTWVDSSAPMRETAERELAPFAGRVSYVLGDVEELPALGLEPADVVVTSRVLHHFSPESIRRVYRAVHALLVPGGLFFDLDHIGVPGDWEGRYRRVRDRFTGARTTPLKPHRHDFPLRRLDARLADAEAAGFDAPDAPWRTLYTALIAARRTA